MENKEIEHQDDIVSIEYTPKELDYRDELIKKLNKANNQRNAEYTELDDMNYLTYYERNKKAANSYIPPKNDPEDTRIVTGITHEKELSLLSSMLQYEFEADIEAYDDADLKITELGNTMQDLIKKSRGIERYHIKRPLFYKELFDQGTAFVEENFLEETIIQKKLSNLDPSVDPEKITWTEKTIIKTGECDAHVLDGTHVYLGNIKEFFIDKQPYIFTLDKLPYSTADRRYGKWKRWKYVPRKVKHFGMTKRDNRGSDWALIEQENDIVEEVKFQDKNGNEYMIMLNGVMMLPIKFPLLWGNSYNIVKGDIEPISPFFAYSKSIPSKTKVDQEVLDEMLRLIILEQQKSYAPPMANNTGQVLSRKIFLPRTIIPNIDPNDLMEIGENKGVSQAQFNGFEMLKKIIDSKSTQPAFGGEKSEGRQTATEITELKKQTMMKLGNAFIGVINFEWQMCRARLPNIIMNWTKIRGTRFNEAKGKIVNLYRTIETKGEIKDKGLGSKIIEFSEEQKSPRQIEAEEALLSLGGEPVRKIYINPEGLRKTIDYNWQINITPVEKDTDELKKAMWFQTAKGLLELFGPESMNMEYLKYRSAITLQEDYDKLFNQGVPAEPMMTEGRRPNPSVESPQKSREKMTRGIMAPVTNRQPSINAIK